MIQQINIFKEQIEYSKKVLLDKGNSLENLLADLKKMDEDQVSAMLDALKVNYNGLCQQFKKLNTSFSHAFL
jgi:hypothetical protein